MLKNGETALHYACLHGHVEVVRVLLAAGIDVNVRDNVRYHYMYICSQHEGGERGVSP